MKKLILIAGLVAGLSAPAFAGANLVVNGDMSSPNLGGGWSDVASGAYGWYNASDSIEIGNSGIYGLGCANTGCQSQEVNANQSPGAVYENISGLKVGQFYKVEYLYGGRPGAVDSNTYMTSSFNGVTLATNSGSSGVWTANVFSIMATATTERLSFTGYADACGGTCGNEITNVAVSAPEVSTWAMMLAGFAGLGFVGYRRQKAGLAA